VNEFVVQEDTAARMARVATRFGFTQRRTQLILVLIVVGASLLAGMTGHAVGYVIGAVIGLALVPCLYLVQRRQMRLMLAGRGYRPGVTITTDFGDDGFTVTTSSGTAHHAYADIGRLAVYDDAVAMWMRGPRYVVVLPKVLVPGERRLRAHVEARPSTRDHPGFRDS
jgi:hypothetical protein